ATADRSTRCRRVRFGEAPRSRGSLRNGRGAARSPRSADGFVCGGTPSGAASAPPRLGRLAHAASAEPWPEELLDRVAAGRSNDPALHPAPVDDDYGRNALDAKSLRQIRPAVDRDADELERLVVSTVLEHLGEEALGAPTAS